MPEVTIDASAEGRIDLPLVAPTTSSIVQQAAIAAQALFTLPRSILQTLTSPGCRYLGYTANDEYQKEFYMIRRTYTGSSTHTHSTDSTNSSRNSSNSSSSSNNSASIWPTLQLPSFQRHIDQYYTVMHALSCRLTEHILTSLGCSDLTYIHSLFEPGDQPSFGSAQHSQNTTLQAASERADTSTKTGADAGSTQYISQTRADTSCVSSLQHLSRTNVTLFRYIVEHESISTMTHCTYHSDISLLTIIPLSLTPSSITNSNSSTVGNSNSSTVGNSNSSNAAAHSNSSNAAAHGNSSNAAAHSNSSNAAAHSNSSIAGLHVYDWSLSKWLDVESYAPQNVAIVFAGECMSYLTNTYLLPCIHEVSYVGPGPRISLPIQFCPAYNALLDPSRLQACLTIDSGERGYVSSGHITNAQYTSGDTNGEHTTNTTTDPSVACTTNTTKRTGCEYNTYSSITAVGRDIQPIVSAGVYMDCISASRTSSNFTSI